MKNLFMTLSLMTFATTALAGNSFFSNFNKSKARDCSPKDLRTKALGDVRDQGNAGWCFAYTTADLVSHRMNKKISATDMAINFYYQMPEMPKTDKLSAIGGGSDMGAMTYTENRYCPEEVMPSNSYELPKACAPGTRKLEALDVIRLVESQERNGSELSECQMAMIKALYRNLQTNDIQVILSNSKTSAFMKINELREKNCQDKRLRPESKLSMRSGLRSGFDSIIDIDEQLNRNNPVSLNYDAWFLLKRARTNGVDNHYSSIVGRRLNEQTNTCQYLIRNSWGKDCSIYPEPYNTQCEEGNIWVDESVLGQNIIGIHFLK